MTARALVCLFLVLSLTPLSAWKNPRKSDTLNTPVFGTHDWIAFKAYVLAGRPAFIKNNLNRFFIVTEPPDNGFKPANAEGGYDNAFIKESQGAVTQLIFRSVEGEAQAVRRSK